MGYRHQRRRITVRFEEPNEFAGFEAVLHGKSLGEFLALIGMGEVDRSSISDQLREMARALVSWNLEDEDTGAPVPATPEAVFEQDQELMLALAKGWIDGLGAGTPAPLEQSSTDGPPSLEASLPMAPLSESPAA